MTNILPSEESIGKIKEAETFAFLITDVIIPDGMSRVDVAGCLAAAGIYSSEDDVAYGNGESDSRNERMVLKAVGHLGHSDHKYNPPALAQLAAAWPANRTVPIDLNTIGAYSYTESGQLMANISGLPFGGAKSIEVAYGAGINLISNMYAAGRMKRSHATCFTRRPSRLLKGWRRLSASGSRNKARWQPTQVSRRRSSQHSQRPGCTQPLQGVCYGGAVSNTW